MTALTMDRNTEYSLGDLLSVPVAASTRIFAGSLVCVGADGYAVPAADTAGLLFAGVATAQADNRTGDDGDLSVVVRRRGRFRFASGSALDQSSLGDKVYAVDDQTVALAAGREQQRGGRRHRQGGERRQRLGLHRRGGPGGPLTPELN